MTPIYASKHTRPPDSNLYNLMYMNAGWCVQLECNYKLRGSRLKELKVSNNAAALLSVN